MDVDNNGLLQTSLTIMVTFKIFPSLYLHEIYENYFHLIL